MVPNDNTSNTDIGAVGVPARLVHGGGLTWRVREVPYATTDRRTGTCLIFDADSVIRRVRNFPADWSTLGDDELYALSLGA